MANSSIQAKISGFAAFIPATATASVEHYEKIYAANRDRVYSFAFWMTDNELAAEELSANTFRRAFALSEAPGDEMIDRSLLAELRDTTPVGVLTLECGPISEVSEIRHNTKRIFLERAIVQLPHTERMIFVMHDGEGYGHDRIARTLGLTEDESRYGLHQARLRIRELVATMK